ncbi:hypothetical protein NP233_g10595 [Leucocoprinus birnbaumii]|uniref:BTB domain-containing protein n=1 Tax=Leucocoprinus birnbaumii TaxID=56174 RepID=A0AAD5VI01_9AGAR|nr:hypothetical protein NP233_g10595 [Leucocoprinus birnbaumii]
MFSGSFAEAGDASSDNPIVVPVPGYSRDCVKQILDFAYTTREPQFERTDSDTDLALEMLTLANSWSMTELHRVLESLIIRLKMVDPFNLEHVLATAESTEATSLVDHCRRYKERNKSLNVMILASQQYAFIAQMSPHCGNLYSSPSPKPIRRWSRAHLIGSLVAAFSAIQSFTSKSSFKGSIFRLPLRRSPGEIGNRVISPDEISELLKSFAREELIDGQKIKLAAANVERSSVESYGQHHNYKSTVQTRVSSSYEEREWRTCSFLRDRGSGGALKTFRYKSDSYSGSTQTHTNCRYCYPVGYPRPHEDRASLHPPPLPLKTEFPVHIHALFSLSQSRQNLRNGGEIGIVETNVFYLDFAYTVH